MWIFNAILIAILIIVIPMVLNTFYQSKYAESTIQGLSGFIFRFASTLIGFIIGASIGGGLFAFFWVLLYVLIFAAGAPTDVLRNMQGIFKNGSLILGSIGSMGLGIASLLNPDAMAESIDEMNRDNPGTSGFFVMFITGGVIIYYLCLLLLI